MIPPSKLSLTSTEWVWVGFSPLCFLLFFLTSLLTPCTFLMIVSCSFRKTVKAAQACSSPPLFLSVLSCSGYCAHGCPVPLHLASICEGFLRLAFLHIPSAAQIGRARWQLLWPCAECIFSVKTCCAKNLAEIRQGQNRYPKGLTTWCDPNTWYFS